MELAYSFSEVLVTKAVVIKFSYGFMLYSISYLFARFLIYLSYFHGLFSQVLHNFTRFFLVCYVCPNNCFLCVYLETFLFTWVELQIAIQYLVSYNRNLTFYSSFIFSIRDMKMSRLWMFELLIFNCSPDAIRFRSRPHFVVDVNYNVTQITFI